MNEPKVRSNLEHILKRINFFQNGKGKINKDDNHSDYTKGIYTPEVILEQTKQDTENALKGLDEYK